MYSDGELVQLILVNSVTVVVAGQNTPLLHDSGEFYRFLMPIYHLTTDGQTPMVTRYRYHLHLLR